MVNQNAQLMILEEPTQCIDDDNDLWCPVNPNNPLLVILEEPTQCIDDDNDNNHMWWIRKMH